MHGFILAGGKVAFSRELGGKPNTVWQIRASSSKVTDVKGLHVIAGSLACTAQMYGVVCSNAATGAGVDRLLVGTHAGGYGNSAWSVTIWKCGNTLSERNCQSSMGTNAWFGWNSR